MLLRVLVLSSLIVTGLQCPAFGQNAKTKKKPLDHSSYDLWRRISGSQISSDGRWVLYTLRPAKGDATLEIRDFHGKKRFSFPRPTGARFTHDGRYVIWRTLPKKSQDKDAKGKKSASKTRSGAPELHILRLQPEEHTVIARARSFALPRESKSCVVYLLDVIPPEKTPPKKKEPLKPKATKSGTSKTTIKPGELVIRELDTGKEQRIPNVTTYTLARNGEWIAYVAQDPKTKANSVHVVQVGKKPLQLAAAADFQSLTFDRAGKQLAFLAKGPKDKAPSVYWWQAPMVKAQAVVTEKTPGFPKGQTIAAQATPANTRFGRISTSSSTLWFSKNGKRLFFRTRPVVEKKSSKKSKVKVDIWHWRDPLLQPEQLVRLRFTRSRSFLAALHLADRRVVALADAQVPSVSVADEGDGDIALGVDSAPYRMLTSWDYPSYRDVYLIDVKTGKRRRILTKVRGTPSLSPKGKYVLWWDYGKLAWMCLPTSGGKARNLSSKIPHPVHRELHDQPSRPGPYGTSMWLDNDAALLIYDRFDVWAVDPASDLPPVCVTDGRGRSSLLTFRVVRTDRDRRTLSPKETLLLSALHNKTKASGYYRDWLGVTRPPRKLLLLDEAVRFVAKAEKAERFLLTRSAFAKYPDLWSADQSLSNMIRLSDANPQQKQYTWGTAELVSWRSLDGVPLQGILYKPEGFTRKRKYPMLVYFYERMSDRLHQYYVPDPGRGSINVSFYVSRGYVVFIPDIAYKTGHPGQSCLNCVLPGVLSIVAKGFVDPKRIGVQGHSWGGYQIAYLVTRTNLFAAAEAGAPVSNMTSAYGGIRWASGKSRMFQYEKTQSRIGGTLWNAQHRYIENSPLFWADRIRTPLLILHNDKDGAVPWYQGIELFVAMRRLGRPCWLFNYNGEAHGLTKAENRRDWAVRLQQFFDHYLKGAPAPRWLSHGVPAEEKGRTLGLELPTK